jgi:hypothetical protein
MTTIKEEIVKGSIKKNVEWSRLITLAKGPNLPFKDCDVDVASKSPPLCRES